MSAQETNQRKRPGGGVDAKSVDAASINQHYYLDSEPPSPRTPLPAPVDSCVMDVLYFPVESSFSVDNSFISGIPTTGKPSTRPGGVHRGGRLGVGAEVLVD